MSILEVLNFDFSKLEQLSSPKFAKIQNSGSQKLPKMTFSDRLNSPNHDFMYNWSGTVKLSNVNKVKPQLHILKISGA